jgi:hypothetical protein
MRWAGVAAGLKGMENVFRNIFRKDRDGINRKILLQWNSKKCSQTRIIWLWE